MKIQHMAFAVRNVEAALARYSDILAVDKDIDIVEFQGSRTRVANFFINSIEYQLCQSMDADGRFASWIDERGSEGLHHICYAVDSIDDTLAHAKAQGATLRMCRACGVVGSHPHPEGFVAFLDDDITGLEIEFMQLYTPDELEKYSEINDV